MTNELCIIFENCKLLAKEEYRKGCTETPKFVSMAQLETLVNQIPTHTYKHKDLSHTPAHLHTMITSSLWKLILFGGEAYVILMLPSNTVC